MSRSKPPNLDKVAELIEEVVNEEIKKRLSSAGQKGGRATSDRKTKAVRANAAKARQAKEQKSKEKTIYAVET